MHHAVVGFQITAANLANTQRFYEQAFGWSFEPGPHDNVMDTDAHGQTPGSIIGRGDIIPDYVSLFIASEDLDASIQSCVEAGGELIRPTFALPNGDQLAIVADPEGHVLTLIKRSG